MHVANCEYLLLSILCEMNADQSLFVMDLNESMNLGYGQLHTDSLADSSTVGRMLAPTSGGTMFDPVA